MNVRHVILTLVALLVLAPGALPAQVVDPKEIEFFEQKIRPVLVQHCYACHSEKAAANGKLKAELLLDSREGMAKGGESGPVLVPKKPDESLLIKALRYDGNEMPPAGKLPDDVIADFAKWIALGAPDPRDGQAVQPKPREIDIVAGRRFWSFQPLKEVTPPAAPNAAWAKTPIDRFILAKQTEHGLTANAAAGKEKLMRRVCFDLVGLPPTPEQIAAFVADNSPNAYELVIDRLLASEQYGERWARHWLDAARFAESGGYEFDGFRPGAYHYRDWVIRAFNNDLSYNEFVRMQIAGDTLQPGFQGAAATGFLVAGPFPGQITAKTEERIRYDQLDDMIMTIGGSMLGVTLGCVRCHDHKYDPFPQQDYYGIAAALGRTGHGRTTLDPDPPATQRALDQHAAEHETRLAAWRKFAADELPARFTRWQQEELPKLTAQPRWQVLTPQSVSADDTWLTTTDDGLVVFIGPRRKNGDTYTVTAQTFQKDLVALRLDALMDKALPRKGPGFGSDGSFLGDFKVVARSLDSKSAEAPVTLKLKPVLAAFEEPGQPLKNVVDDNPGTFWRANADGGKDNAALFEIEGGLAGFPAGTQLTFELKFVSEGLGRFRLAASTEPGVPTWAGEVAPQHLGEIKSILAGNNNALPEPLREPMVRWFGRFDEAAGKLCKLVDDHARAKPRPPLTEVYTAVAGGRDVFLLRRGEVDSKLGPAQPAFLQVLASTPNGTEQWLPKPAEGQPALAPRVGLANWITDVERGAGALLARVIVNRLWQHHFGKGLVETPNDFGAQGERPTHPELLDWLALELVKGGWKLKPIHKLIVHSAVYQQNNDVAHANLKIDPLNEYLWHYRPRRLDAEVIRDALLAVGASLDTTMYGPSILDNVPRRSVYLRVKRSELIPFLTIFDAPEPTQSIGERISTTAPTQALAMMNSPFVRQQAERLAQRIRPSPEVALATAIDNAYIIAFCRLPAAAERERMLTFIEQQRQAAEGDATQHTTAALVEFCQVVLCLNEFVYID